MNTLINILIVAVILAVYYYPTTLSLKKEKKNILGMLFWNSLLGWTIIGYFVLLHKAKKDE